MSSPPTKSAPAASASRTFSPLAITRTFFVLPSPCGRTTVPRTIWSACLGSTPRRIVRSTVSSNLANFTFWRRGTASCSVYGRFSTAPRAFSTFFPDFFMLLLVSHRCRSCLATVVFTTYKSLVILSENGENRSPFESKDLLLRYDLNPHRPRSALYALHCGFHRCSVEVGHLLLGDLQHLLLGHLADLIFIRSARSLGHTCGTLQQNRCRRRLGNEREAA